MPPLPQFNTPTYLEILRRTHGNLLIDRYTCDIRLGHCGCTYRSHPEQSPDPRDYSFSSSHNVPLPCRVLHPPQTRLVHLEYSGNHQLYLRLQRVVNNYLRPVGILRLAVAQLERPQAFHCGRIYENVFLATSRLTPTSP